MIIAIKTSLDSLAAWQSRQMMTEKLSSQSVTSSQKPFALGHDHVPPSTAEVKVDGVDEEEPYTLTCVCGITDDDGSTIQCERCDSWQHINCYYPDLPPFAASDADFRHTCADCRPRLVDRPRAVKRMQRWLADRAAERAEREAVDRKSSAKRPPAKNPKKKPRPIDVHVNGTRDNGKHGSPNDHAQPAPKKPKVAHRSSQSVSSQSAKRSPPHGNNSRPQSTPHPPSPATTPPDLPDNFKIHTYSTAFCSLYTEPQFTIVRNNSFASIGISNTMSLWLREPERMRQETGRTFGEVFEDLTLNATPRPRIRIDEKSSLVERGAALHWRFLTTDDPISKDVPLIELNGVVGFQKDYCCDPSSLWAELTSPLPFVFFHPSLPLYIDTRDEGSEARYVRRSCKPNSQLTTTISEGPGPEYRFWLVSDRGIAAGEQITLPWDFRLHKDFEARWLHLLGLGDDSFKDEGDMTDDEYTSITEWVHRILSEYGGCACDLGSDCAFARFHRHHLYAKAHHKAPNKKKAAAPKKVKVQAMSPNSTGQATNSRAASESHAEGGDDDGRSGSEPSKPPSRDRTPVRQGSFDQSGVLTELTDRDKRKVAMAEDTFRRMEQQPFAKKKKRGSDGSTSQSAPKKAKATPTHPSTEAATTGMYSDACTNTSRGKSGSPVGSTGAVALALQHAAPIPRVCPRPVYVDSTTQTDPESATLAVPSVPHGQRKRIVSLSQRFLANRYQAVMLEERRRSLSVSDRPCTPMSVPTSMDLDSPQPSPRTSVTPDANVSPTTIDKPRSNEHSTVKMAPPPHSDTMHAPNGSRRASLHVQLPPVPLFNQPASGLADSATMAASPSTSLAQSPLQVSAGSLNFPFSPYGMPTPSPIKKKLSLSDYTRRNKKTGAGPGSGPKSETDDTKPGDRPMSSGTD